MTSSFSEGEDISVFVYLGKELRAGKPLREINKGRAATRGIRVRYTALEII